MPFIAGMPAIASNQVSSTLGTSSDEHGLVVGAWSQLLIGTWGAVELIVDPYTQKRKGIIEVTSFQMVDIQLRHPQSFCKGTGITIA